MSPPGAPGGGAPGSGRHVSGGSASGGQQPSAQPGFGPIGSSSSLGGPGPNSTASSGFSAPGGAPFSAAPGAPVSGGANSEFGGHLPSSRLYQASLAPQLPLHQQPPAPVLAAAATAPAPHSLRQSYNAVAAAPPQAASVHGIPDDEAGTVDLTPNSRAGLGSHFLNLGFVNCLSLKRVAITTSKLPYSVLYPLLGELRANYR